MINLAQFKKSRITAVAALLGLATLSHAQAETLVLGSASTKLELNPEDHSYVVTDKRTGREWTAPSFNRRFNMRSAVKVSETQISVEFRDKSNRRIYTSTITLDGDKLSFDLTTEHKEAPFTELFYPTVPQSDLKDGHLIFCNRSSGIRLPINTTDYPEKRLVSYANTGALDIPIFGILDSASDDGLMLVLETPTEATINIIPNKEGIIEPELLWFDSFKSFAYDRRVTMHFIEEGGYTAMAHRYREWELENAPSKTLVHKAAGIERVNWLKGAAVVWGNIGESIIDEAPVHGIHRMMLNGRFTSEAMQKAKDLGYLLGEYDNYSDITDGPLGSSKDNIEEAGLYGPDGEVILGWRTKEGKQYYNRSPRFARRAAEAVIPGLLEKYPYTARFFDVHSAIQFFESYHPEYPMDRRSDMKYRQSLYGYLGELGLVAGGEASKGWCVPYIDYTEGNMSGSFYWFSDTGHLIRLKSREEIPWEYLKFGMDPTIRVPLWELVYHDKVVSTWYWGDSNGYFYDIAPELSEVKDTMNVLHATMPLVWLDHLCYGWHRERDRMLETIYTTTRLHERLAFDAMTRHSFISENQKVQQTEFSSGAVVQANFDNKPQKVTTPCGKDVVLAPNGYMVSIEDFQQSKLWIGGAAETHVQSDEFLYVKTTAKTARSIGPAKVAGELAAYRVLDGTWNVRYRSSEPVKLDLVSLGIISKKDPFRAVYINDKGQAVRPFKSGKSTIIELPATEESVLLKIHPGMDPQTPMIIPESGRVTQETPVKISVADSALDIRYTLDGSKPTRRSPKYTEPIFLEKGARIKAASFTRWRKVGDVREAALSVEVKLFTSPITRGSEKPVEVNIPLQGLSELQIQITDAEDGPHYDQAVMGDAHFTSSSQGRVSLSTYPPRSAIRFTIENNARQYEGEPIRIGGIPFEDGISSHSIDQIVYELGDDFTHFKAWVGIHDRTSRGAPKGQKNGSVQYIFTGVSSPEE
ncbi:MAG: glycoside hydrolase [Puniceicoccaceae bacterium]